MELRQELQLHHPLVEVDLMRRGQTYITKLLGQETTQNREAYEQTKRQVENLLCEKKEYRIPVGAYLFSTEPRFVYRQAQKAGILAEGIFVFGLKEYVTEDVEKQYLMHVIQIAMMNAVRDYMQEVLVPQLYQYGVKEQAPYVSEFFGPGLFEEPLFTLKEMVELTNVRGIHVSEKGTLLIPDMSFAGALYVTKDLVTKEVPCLSCRAKIGCEYCMKKR